MTHLRFIVISSPLKEIFWECFIFVKVRKKTKFQRKLETCTITLRCPILFPSKSFRSTSLVQLCAPPTQIPVARKTNNLVQQSPVSAKSNFFELIMCINISPHELAHSEPGSSARDCRRWRPSFLEESSFNAHRPDQTWGSLVLWLVGTIKF